MLELIYHGHSFVEISTPDCVIFIDPFVSNNPSCDITIEQSIAKKPSYIIITHGHDDHIGDSLELTKKTNATLVCTYELGVRAKEQGIENVSDHGIGGAVTYGEEGKSVLIKFTPAFHGSMINGSVAAGVVVTIAGHTVFHAGDSGLTIEYELLGRYESISCAFLPIGNRYTMGIDDAVVAASMIKAQYVVPIHYNTRPAINADAGDFARKIMLDNYGVPKALSPGQMIVLE